MLVPTMTNINLSRRALDVLNRAAEIKSENDFCGEDGGLSKEMRGFAEWLGDCLREELQRETWAEPCVDAYEGGIVLYLHSDGWQLPDDEYVAFSFWIPNLLEDDSPCVQLYIPTEDTFLQRNELLQSVRPKLKRKGFTDYYEPGDPDPSFPLWKSIRLEEFQKEYGFDLKSFTAAIVAGFRELLEIEPLIDIAFQSITKRGLPGPSNRGLETIAILDTEYDGQGAASRLTQLAIINVAYDTDGDAVVGILDEYCMSGGESLDEVKARAVLDRAEFVVAHNAFGADRPMLVRYLPGSEKKNWLCSLQGIDWKGLLDVQNVSLETLLRKVGLRLEQDHDARPDARDLKNLLALKHHGRTYLGRLLDTATPRKKAATALGQTTP